MDAIIRFLQDTGFYLFSQDGNWRCLIMLGIACVLLYLGIVLKRSGTFFPALRNAEGRFVFHRKTLCPATVFYPGASALLIVNI